MQSEVRDLFQEAIVIPAEQREEWLIESCPDAEVRAEVLELLEHDGESDTILGRPVRAAAAQLDSSHQFTPGMKIGAFELGRLLGAGGMGRVFEAYRVDAEIQQTVAIKVLDHAVSVGFRKGAMARFLQERRILASLQHPYIATLIDAGTFRGIPYFAMERVEGLPVDEYAAQRGLDIRGCVRLVLKVCEAVETAHQNLIVHRDIKPTNILVTADGTPKLLDFGIAKELYSIGLTHTGGAALTPEYASPEQITGSAVTVATDVYGLGGLLYRMLTGRAPHSVEERSPAEWVRAAMEEVTAPSTYRKDLKGDLENILRKALHRDPKRRYESARAFSDDLCRYLDGRPVQATPDSLAYRVKTRIRRNRLLTAVTALAVISLVAGTAFSVHQARRAQQRFDQVRQLANVFLFDFERAIRDTPGTLAARELVASTGQKYLKQLAAESRDDDTLQREIAEAYERLADIQGALQPGGGKSPAETESLLRSLEIRRALGDAESVDSGLRRKYIDLASHLGYRYQDGKSSGGAAKWAEEAMQRSEHWLVTEPDNPDALVAATAAFMRGATTYEVAGRIDRAMQSLEKSVAYGQQAMAVWPGDRKVRLLVCGAERTYSELLQTAKRYPEALTHAIRSMELIEPLYRQNPEDRPVRMAYVNTISAVGIAERSLGDSDARHYAKALPYLRRAYDTSLEWMMADQKNSRAKSMMVVHAHRLCSLLIEMKKYDEAAELFRKSAEVTRELARIDPANRRSWYLLGKTQLDLGWMYLESGRPAEAKQAFLASDEGFERALQMDPQDTVVLECRAGQWEGLAQAAVLMGNRDEARQWMARCLDLMREMVQRDPSVKSYIFEYEGKLKLAREVGLGVEGL